MKIIKLKKDSRGRTPCGEFYHETDKEYYDPRIDKSMAVLQKELGMKVQYPYLIGPLEGFKIVREWKETGNMYIPNPKMTEPDTVSYDDPKEDAERYDESGFSKW